MPRIKRIIPAGFTTVKNDFLMDKGMPLAARGLLMTMLSLPDGWNMSGKGLAAILPDGRDKVYSTLKILELNGYLKRVRIRENGCFVDVEYQFCDSPIFLSDKEREKQKKENERKKARKKKKAPCKQKEVNEKKEGVNFSSISRKNENTKEMAERLVALKGAERKAYIEDVVLEKEECIKAGVPDEIIKCVTDVFAELCKKTKTIEEMQKLTCFSKYDVMQLSRVLADNEQPQPDELAHKLFTTEPFLKESENE